VVTVGGTLGGKLEPGGRFVECAWQERTLGSFYNTLLHAAGVERERFGAIDINVPIENQQGPMPELLT